MGKRCEHFDKKRDTGEKTKNVHLLYITLRSMSIPPFLLLLLNVRKVFCARYLDKQQHSIPNFIGMVLCYAFYYQNRLFTLKISYVKGNVHHHFDFCRLIEADQSRSQLEEHKLRLEKTLISERDQRMKLEETLATLQEQMKLAAENKEVCCG